MALTVKDIWKQGDLKLEHLNELGARNMGHFLGITFLEKGPDYLKAGMPVDEKTRQPFGLLHGGASAVLAETLGSVASWLCIDPQQQQAVGIEINCNHVRGKRSGMVTGTVRPIHVGGTIHVWDIKIHDEGGHLISVGRLTVAIRNKTPVNK